MIKKLMDIGEDNSAKVITNEPLVDNAIMVKARKEYYEIVSFLRNKGVRLDINLANKLKNDVIEHQQVLNFIG